MKTQSITLLALAAILACLATACRQSNSPLTPGPGDPLDGTTWTLMAYRKTRPISGTTLTATFQDGQIRGSAGCNSYSGSYQVNGEAISVGPIAITEMACLEPEGIMEQEMLFAQFLSDAQTFRLADGKMELVRTDGEALTFVPRE